MNSGYQTRHHSGELGSVNKLDQGRSNFYGSIHSHRRSQFFPPSRDTFDVNGNNPDFHSSVLEQEALLSETPASNSLRSPSDDGNHERKIAC